MAYTESITIIKDTREQEPLSFARYKDVNEITDTLKVGDYKGILHTRYGDLVSRTIYDRKEKDLWQTFATKDGHRRIGERFNDSINSGSILVIAIISCLIDIRNGFGFKTKAGYKRSKFTGSSMVALLKTMNKRYGMRFLYTSSRTDLQLHIVSDYMAECKEVNQLLKDFDKSGDWSLLERIDGMVYLWE